MMLTRRCFSAVPAGLCALLVLILASACASTPAADKEQPAAKAAQSEEQAAPEKAEPLRLVLLPVTPADHASSNLETDEVRKACAMLEDAVKTRLRAAGYVVEKPAAKKEEKTPVEAAPSAPAPADAEKAQPASEADPGADLPLVPAGETPEQPSHEAPLAPEEDAAQAFETSAAPLEGETADAAILEEPAETETSGAAEAAPDLAPAEEAAPREEPAPDVTPEAEVAQPEPAALPQALEISLNEITLESRTATVAGRERTIHTLHLAGSYVFAAKEDGQEPHAGEVSVSFRREGSLPATDRNLRKQLMAGAVKAFTDELINRLRSTGDFAGGDAGQAVQPHDDRSKYQDSPGKQLKPKKS